MKADKYGTTTQQHLWRIDYKTNSERNDQVSNGCSECHYCSIIQSTAKTKLLCQYSINIPVKSKSVCKNWKSRVAA